MGVEIYESELRLRHRWEISGGGIATKRNAFVRLAHEGTVGMGEAAFHSGFGESRESVWSELQGVAQDLRENPLREIDRLPLHGAARTAVDMAQRDWKARRAGQPLATFLGLPLPAAPVRTSFSIGIADPETIREKTAEAPEFEVLKIKLGTDPENDRSIVAAVRSATDRPIRVDANGGWKSREEAAYAMEWLAADRAVELVEQPLPPGHLEETAWLRDRFPLPIVLDEEVGQAGEVAALAGCCDGINIKLMKTGGIGEALRTAEAARGAGLKVMLGCMIESSLAIGAALHLASLAEWVDLDSHLLLANDPFEGLGLVDGGLVLPAGPGIGVRRRDSDS